MAYFICETCGVQYANRADKPASFRYIWVVANSFKLYDFSSSSSMLNGLEVWHSL